MEDIENITYRQPHDILAQPAYFLSIFLIFQQHPIKIWFERRVKVECYFHLRFVLYYPIAQTQCITLYTGVSLSEQVPLSRPPLCNSLSESTRYRNVLVIGTYSLSEQIVPIRSTLNIFVTYSLSEQSWVPITSTYSLSEQIVLIRSTFCYFVLIRSTAGRTPYRNNLIR